jgi:Arf-GAP/GTPase/ANK repeat/PH domain-containing protein 1/3
MKNLGKFLKQNHQETSQQVHRQCKSYTNSVTLLFCVTREQRERYIKAKYCDKEFLCELPPSDLPLPLRLLDAVKSDDPVICLQLLAHCTIDDVNYEHPLHHGGSVLHVACNLGRVIIVQLLVWNLADVDLLDYQKHSPLFYARIAGYEDCAQILIQNNCNEDIGPHQSPLSSEFGSTEKL